MLKYIVVRRIAFRNYCCDPRSLVVYATTAAAAFATVENILYVMGSSHGASFSTGVLRMFTAIPLHCSTGVLIGAALGRRKFLQDHDTDHFWHALVVPICVHGTYDFIAFSSSGASITWLEPFLLLTLIISILWGRKRLLQLEIVPHVNIHDLAVAHRIWKPLEFDNMGSVTIWQNIETLETATIPPPRLLEFPCMCCLGVCCDCCME